MRLYNDDFYAEFFRGQSVLITGGTGGLGSCLVYKLSVLQVKKIFVLSRGTKAVAESRWQTHLLHAAQGVLATGRVVLLKADYSKPCLGLLDDDWRQIQQVNLVIHAAANISFGADLREVVKDNCLGALNMAHCCRRLPHLRAFVPISSAFCNAHLPDGVIEERLYELDDPNEELRYILRHGTSPHLPRRWPYAYSKHLTERLLVKNFPDLPLLIIRPTSIGPAIQEPFELYGPQASCPIENLLARVIRSGIGVWYSNTHYPDGTNILDEVPVDIVCNKILQYVILGIRGIRHISSQCYHTRTISEFFHQLLVTLPPHEASRIGCPRWIPEYDTGGIEQCPTASFYQIGGRNWIFEMADHDVEFSGQLDCHPINHDPHAFLKKRVICQYRRQGERKFRGKL